MSNSAPAAGANQLRKNSLGVSAVTFLVVSAAAPLTAVAGGVPVGMLLGNGVGIPAAFLLVTLVLLLFAVGYVAMARHVTTAGGFYAFTAQSLGGRAGGAASMIAILGYNTMQIGLLGLLGAIAAPTFAPLGLDLPWWAWSMISIVAVGVLGYRQVDLSAKILMVLVLLEYFIVIIIDVAILTSGGDSGLTLAPFSWSSLMSGSPAIGILFAFAAFIGFEATTIYAEEARDPRSTVPRATYLSVLLIGVFYMVTTWLMVMGVGMDKLMPTLQGLADPTAFLFDLAGRYVGGPVPTIMGYLLVTSLFAGVVAFHNGAARYKYVAGREGLLPDGVGVTHSVFQSPHVGSIIQTVIAFVVVAGFALAGLDPVLQLFTWLTNIGTLAIIGLMALSSLAVVKFFATDKRGESAMTATLLPGLAGAILGFLFLYIFYNFGDIAGAAGALGWALAGLVIVAGVIGYALASGLAARDPARFARLGRNA